MLHQFINRLTHQVQPIVECLIRRKVREPGKQIFFVEQYPLEVISVATFPTLFFPAQVMIGIESTNDFILSQS